MAWMLGRLMVLTVPMTRAATPVQNVVTRPEAMATVNAARATTVAVVQVRNSRLRSTRSDQAPAGTDSSIAGSPRAMATRPSADGQSVSVTTSHTKVNRSVPLIPV